MSVQTPYNKLGCYELTEDRKKGKVLFTSSRKFKGLESDAIILIDIESLYDKLTGKLKESEDCFKGLER